MLSGNLKNEIKDYFFITLGCTIYGLTALSLLVPHKIIGGGATGLATIFYYLSQESLNIGVGFALINGLLLLFALKILGPKFGLKSLYGIVVLIVVLAVFQPYFNEPFLEDKFMSTIIAGMLVGLGIALSFNAGGSTGGTDIIVMIIRKFRNVSAGRMLLYIDTAIILCAISIGAGLEEITYGFVLMGIVAYTVDFILIGKKQSAQFFIISENHEEVAQRISEDVNRGVTLLSGEGWYSKHGKKVIFVVVPKKDALMVLRIVKQVDPKAFMTMNTVMGVFGEGFEHIQEIK